MQLSHLKSWPHCLWGPGASGLPASSCTTLFLCWGRLGTVATLPSLRLSTRSLPGTVLSTDTRIISFNPRNSLTRWARLLSMLSSRRNWGPDRLTNWPKTTQWVSAGAEIHTQVLWCYSPDTSALHSAASPKSDLAWLSQSLQINVCWMRPDGWWCGNIN